VFRTCTNSTRRRRRGNRTALSPNRLCEGNETPQAIGCRKPMACGFAAYSEPGRHAKSPAMWPAMSLVMALTSSLGMSLTMAPVASPVAPPVASPMEAGAPGRPVSSPVSSSPPPRVCVLRLPPAPAPRPSRLHLSPGLCSPRFRCSRPRSLGLVVPHLVATRRISRPSRLARQGGSKKVARAGAPGHEPPALRRARPAAIRQPAACFSRMDDTGPDGRAL